MTVIDAALATSIRTVLGETEASLPTEVITDPLIGGAAETVILQLVEPPAYADRSAADQAAIRRAVAYLTASYLVRSRKRQYSTTSERWLDQYQRSGAAVDADGWAKDLEELAYEAIDGLQVDRPFNGGAHFQRATGGRGR